MLATTGHIHQPMSTQASPSSPAEKSETHHGLSEAGERRRAMDVDPDASRGPAAPADSHDIDSSIARIADTSAAPVKVEQASNASVAESVPREAAAAAVEVSEPKLDGPLLFCQKEYAPSRPHPTQDLFALYGLTPLAASVARIDPVTKEKINKMRSSYQNQVKGFQLAGRNKAVKHEDGITGISLSEMVAWPEEEWKNQKVSADLSKGLSTSALAKLEKAFSFDTTPVPKNDEWESILGHEKGKPVVFAAADAKSKQPLSGTQKPPKVNGHSNGVGRVGADGEPARPRRTGKKRRYDEDSFEGYGEGFVDDRDDVDGGYSSGDSRSGSVSKKKRRKDYNSLNQPVGGNVGNYGVGMVQQQHVGRGIGAFGGR